ncbi:hypothetical protein BDY19DRAFT_990496 [Irpex rosettiformis]|uniref:Uncharacterized protein n=1 Tax=Irpex rosettiformis TaxID=378272 RepID=A0ACB8UGM0_9APHY|nr:hypothetical protein BDY19DRAFT_990496 [Irpex rosettiformis]
MPSARSLRSLAISPPKRRQTQSPGPPSPTFSEATNASAMNFGPDGPDKIITRADLKASLQAYEDLVNKCATYRTALMAMSRAAAGFADAMTACSILKGPNYETGTRMQAASGLHHLMSNHWVLMADTLDKQFERPLRQHLETYRSVVAERSNTYEKALREKSNAIRRTERENMQRKGRSLQTFREALTVLQRQVDELDDLKSQHYQDIVAHEEEVWDFVQGKTCLVVRSTLDVFDRLTSKASDPVIEPMLQAIPDPFDSYGPPPEEDKIFSILPPLSVIANTPSASPSPLTASTPELESSSDGISSNKSSWANPTGGFFPEGSAAWADVTSASSATSPISSPSTSPPVISRKHSFPPTIGPSSHSHRKSESKLRSVLSVIDESRSVHGGSSLGDGERTPVPSHPSSSTNGHAVDIEDASSPWSDNATPRNSGILQSATPDGTPPGERSRSPQSDETAHPAATAISLS